MSFYVGVLSVVSERNFRVINNSENWVFFPPQRVWVLNIILYIKVQSHSLQLLWDWRDERERRKEIYANYMLLWTSARQGAARAHLTVISSQKYQVPEPRQPPSRPTALFIIGAFSDLVWNSRMKSLALLTWLATVWTWRGTGSNCHCHFSRGCPF